MGWSKQVFSFNNLQRYPSEFYCTFYIFLCINLSFCIIKNKIMKIFEISIEICINLTAYCFYSTYPYCWYFIYYICSNDYEYFFQKQVGFSHSNILHAIIQHASLRFQQLQSHNSSLKASNRSLKSTIPTSVNPKSLNRRKVFVIFGGNTSERQVSLMSGTNVWLNLQTFNDVSLKKSFFFVHCNFLFW